MVTKISMKTISQSKYYKWIPNGFFKKYFDKIILAMPLKRISPEPLCDENYNSWQNIWKKVKESSNIVGQENSAIYFCAFFGWYW